MEIFAIRSKSLEVFGNNRGSFGNILEFESIAQTSGNHLKSDANLVDFPRHLKEIIGNIYIYILDICANHSEISMNLLEFFETRQAIG